MFVPFRFQHKTLNFGLTFLAKASFPRSFNSSKSKSSGLYQRRALASARMVLSDSCTKIASEGESTRINEFFPVRLYFRQGSLISTMVPGCSQVSSFRSAQLQNPHNSMSPFRSSMQTSVPTNHMFTYFLKLFNKYHLVKCKP